MSWTKYLARGRLLGGSSNARTGVGMTDVKKELDFLRSRAYMLGEFESRQAAYDADVLRIAAFLPRESARMHIRRSDALITVEEKNVVFQALIPLAKFFGISVSDLDDIAENVSDDEAESLSSALAQSWLHVVLAGWQHRDDAVRATPLTLRADLTPDDDLSSCGTANPFVWLTMGVIALDAEVSRECYLEFADGIRKHLKDNPTDGLLIDGHNNIRLYEDGGEYVARPA